MGYTNLYLVPKDPEYAPPADAIPRLAARIAKWTEENAIPSDPSTELSERPMYFGTVPETLPCPSCGSTVDLSDEELDEWAYEFRNSLWTARDARNLVIHMPCCQATLKAGELPLESRRRWSEAHYARFAVYVHDVRDDEFSPEELQEFGALLGCELHQFTESGT
ncbi:hypothetical protein [Ramlibacter pallidus]|uniref:Uncharacterized protein n=1 Tax=Ramlibacter pallidus TaxID=2780087 RepID=A0ABR9S3I4_9BURK|nr:hypothetical protein [Ramlibacter pallidus]MBE7368066.1 hypothetical protein [Ramlibacter pallidus]